MSFDFAKPLKLAAPFDPTRAARTIAELEALAPDVLGLAPFAALIGSASVSAVSSLFNWFAMKRGALLVGGEGAAFRHDLRRLPLLAVSFVISGPRHLWQSARNISTRGNLVLDQPAKSSREGGVA